MQKPFSDAHLIQAVAGLIGHAQHCLLARGLQPEEPIFPCQLARDLLKGSWESSRDVLTLPPMMALGKANLTGDDRNC